MSAAPRSLVAVIDWLFEVIPKQEHALRAALESVRSSAEFAPPELMSIHWERGAEVLNDAIPEDRPESWCKEVERIWLGKITR